MGEIVCISMSYGFEDEEIYHVLEEVISRYPNQNLVVEGHDDVIEELAEKYNVEVVPYYPIFPRFKKKTDAYEDRAQRMVKYATACHCFVNLEDRKMGPMFVAMAFKKKHPEYLLEIYLKLPGEWERITLQKLMGLYKWE